MKRSLSLAAVLLLSLSLVACAQKVSEPQPETPVSSGFENAASSSKTKSAYVEPNSSPEEPSSARELLETDDKASSFVPPREEQNATSTPLQETKPVSSALPQEKDAGAPVPPQEIQPAVSSPQETAQQETPPEASSQEEVDPIQPLQIQVGSQSFTATLHDNETARALIQKLPLTVTMSEMNGNEKYHYFSDSLPVNASQPASIHAGDLMLYGSDCLVLFYESFSTSYSYTLLGSVDDPAGLSEALGTGDVQVSFQLAD